MIFLIEGISRMTQKVDGATAYSGLMAQRMVEAEAKVKRLEVASNGARLEAERAEKQEPRKIVMPTSPPPKFKCPVHGIIEQTLVFEIDGNKHVFCKKCAMQFAVDLLNLNLNKLELINENGTVPAKNAMD